MKSTELQKSKQEQKKQRFKIETKKRESGEKRRGGGNPENAPLHLLREGRGLGEHLS
jgi:hypothetical protein